MAKTIKRTNRLAVAVILISVFTGGCRASSTSAGRRASAKSLNDLHITVIDPRDTAAYAEAGAEAVLAVASCHAPRCRPDIFRGPAEGELTVGLDSSAGRPPTNASLAEYQWHLVPEPLPPGGQAFQDSSWASMLTKWEQMRPRRLMLVDGVPRTFAYVREHLSLAAVSGIQEVSARDATRLSSDPDAVNGAIDIVTKAHAAAR